MIIECPSAIARVVVHARGALVTREVELPSDLAEGVVDVAVPDITVEADPGSARAALEDSDRIVAAVHTSLVIPKGESRPGPTRERTRELASKIARIDEEHRELTERRTLFLEAAIRPRLRRFDRKERPRDALDTRFAEALRMGSLLTTRTAALDERLLRLEKERRDLSRELEAARLEDAQTGAERVGEGRARRTISARLLGDGRPGRLLVTYAVAAARWWPTYTLRVGEGGDATRASWTFEALVAQDSGEDWVAVAVALSSGDLLFDARLPELASLRFGRQQPPVRRPFRPAPVGVDDMFVSYMEFRSRIALAPEARSAQPSRDGAAVIQSFDVDDDAETMVTGKGPVAIGGVPAAPSPTRAPAGSGGPPPGAIAAKGAPLRMPLPPPAPMAVSAPAGAMMMQAKRVAETGAFSGFAAAVGGGAWDGPADAFAEVAEHQPEELELVVGARWNDYDKLVLLGPEEPHRGRLAPDTNGASYGHGASHGLSAGDPRLRDPVETRGMFDHRYEAGGRADVPSDGRLHRVSVAAGTSAVQIAWRCVPSEAPDVYREAHFTNPFDTGLLGGPVDVYLDGSLLAATTIERIDRGGSLFCGMGVDDRIKVARNVRAAEESAGILGGAIAVTHHVDIEISSTLKEPVEVTVLERVPVTDDKAIEVKVLEQRPPATPYDQADRGDPVRGGLRFEVIAVPGKKVPIHLSYRLVFSQKLEIVGGNRRG